MQNLITRQLIDEEAAKRHLMLIENGSKLVQDIRAERFIEQMKKLGQYGTGVNKRYLPFHTMKEILGEELFRVVIKAHVLTGDDALSKIGSKHTAPVRDPVKYLFGLAESDELLQTRGWLKNALSMYGLVPGAIIVIGRSYQSFRSIDLFISLLHAPLALASSVSLVRVSVEGFGSILFTFSVGARSFRTCLIHVCLLDPPLLFGRCLSDSLMAFCAGGSG